MRIETVVSFISSYNQRYNQSFDDSLQGQLQAIFARLNEPFMHLSSAFKKELDLLLASLSQNIKVGVVGQFSSGKSSLLNLILQRDILSTGLVPVTFKPTFLRYADEYCLRVEYMDGSDELLGINEIHKFTDQRLSDTKEAKSLHVFAPIKLLKKLTLVDTPGLNANELDSLSTFDELSSFHALIWLSLIDNAGKKSEEDSIKANLELFSDKSICVLNQKDRLNDEDLQRIMHYSKEVFSKYFSQIIAISCKEAKDKSTYEKSNFKALLDFLENLDERSLKKSYIKTRLNKLLQILDEQFVFLDNIYDSLELILSDFESFLSSNHKHLEEKISILNQQILLNLKTVAEKISKQILANIKEKKAYYYKEKSSLLHKNCFAKHEYNLAFISSDDTFLAMFYNSDVLSKEFKKMKKAINDDFNRCKDEFNQIFSFLDEKLLLFSSRYTNIQPNSILQSDAIFSTLQSFASSLNQLFAKDFKDELFKGLLELDLFFEKLNLKAFANYENATKLSLAFFSRKINASKSLYELDSTEFSLYYPSLNEIYERVLTELNVHEFETLLINKPVMLKIYKEYIQNFKALILQKLDIIKDKKAENSKRKQWLLSVRNDFGSLL